MSELLQRRSLSEQVYDVLIHDIATGQIALGDRLINRELQTRFGVSSTPIRDAINKLYQDGLIRELTNSGAQLIDFDQQYAEELNHFIMMLACEALALASQSDQQAEIVRLLHEYQDAMEASQENDTEYFGADYRFHKVFFDYCGNRFLKETYKRYNRIRSLLISSAMRASRDRQPSVDQHRQITAAFEAGQFDLARERMREHYQYGVHLLLDRENHA